MARLLPATAYLHRRWISLALALAIGLGGPGALTGQAQVGVPAGSSVNSALPLLSPTAPTARVFRQGNIQYTSVFFRGRALFPVTAQIDPLSPTSDGPALVAMRARTVEEKLNAIFNAEIDPVTLEVGPAQLEGQTVILVSNPPSQATATPPPPNSGRVSTVVVTVTNLDAQLAQTLKSELAEEWADIIKTALIEAWEEIQPPARRLQRRRGIEIGVVILVLSALLWRLQTELKSRSGRLRLQRQALLEQDSQTAPAAPPGPDQLDAERSRILKARSRLNQLLGLQQSGRSLLRLGQVAVWLGGISAILRLFPETRVWGNWLFTFPGQVLVIFVVLYLLTKLANLLVNKTLHQKLDDNPLTDRNEQRLILRSSTLEGVFSGIVNAVAVSIGLLWLLLIQNIDLSALLTGAGIFGAALGLIFQNLIRDWLNGVLIIFEDQYAVGDVVNIDGTTGFVEAMSIRATQIRSDGGRLSTIPHNLVGVVHNLTKDWARIDFTITIANQANPVEAMALMQETIRAMGHDPLWRGDILDPVVLIGVSNVSATGTELLMWIQTRRMRQWDVEREFRRRLKQRFEEKGIAIGIPEQKLQLAPMSSGPWVEPSDTPKA